MGASRACGIGNSGVGPIADPAPARLPVFLAYPVVFLSSACSLILEIVAGRILAPYIGVSLYTWTSIIGVVLAGMSAGNFLGGVVADRYASRRVLGLIFIAGSVSSLGILVVTHWLIAANIPLRDLLPVFEAAGRALGFSRPNRRRVRSRSPDRMS